MPLSDVEVRLVEAVRSRQERMLADLTQLVAIPTGHGFAKGLDATREVLSNRLTALGAQVSRLPGGERPNWLREGSVAGSDSADVMLANRLDGAKDGPRILLCGHIDTVHDPHGSFCQLTRGAGGSLLGPGAVDMKGGIVIALCALEALEECSLGVRWSMSLNSDEETGSFASAGHLRSFAKQHDLGLVLEPTGAGGEFVTQRAGSAQFRVDAFGREAHAGRDAALGISATAMLCESITALLASHDPHAGRTINIGPMEGGPATNIVAGHACAWGNARYRTSAQREEIDSALAAIARGNDSEIPRTRVQTIHNRPLKPATPQVIVLADAAMKCAVDLGIASGTISTGGVSDANVLQEAGLACLDGLGVRGGKMHTTDEFVVESSLVERASVLALMMARVGRWSSVPWSQ